MRHDLLGIRILREKHTPRGRVNIRRGPAAGLVGRPLWRRDQAQDPGGGAWIGAPYRLAVPGTIPAASNVADAISAATVSTSLEGSRERAERRIHTPA